MLEIISWKLLLSDVKFVITQNRKHCPICHRDQTALKDCHIILSMSLLPSGSEQHEVLLFGSI